MVKAAICETPPLTFKEVGQEEFLIGPRRSRGE
jgi:hypothetical protein